MKSSFEAIAFNAQQVSTASALEPERTLKCRASITKAIIEWKTLRPLIAKGRANFSEFGGLLDASQWRILELSEIRKMLQLLQVAVDPNDSDQYIDQMTLQLCIEQSMLDTIIGFVTSIWDRAKDALSRWTFGFDKSPSSSEPGQFSDRYKVSLKEQNQRTASSDAVSDLLPPDTPSQRQQMQQDNSPYDLASQEVFMTNARAVGIRYDTLNLITRPTLLSPQEIETIRDKKKAGEDKYTRGSNTQDQSSSWFNF